MNNRSYMVALGGIVSSLCLFAMFLTGVFPFLYLALPMAAGALLTIICTEVNKRWAFLTYLSVSVISILFTFDKEAALIFILLFGHYPILKQIIEKINSKLIRFIIKLLVYNICAAADFLASVYLLGIKDLLNDVNKYGKYGLLALLIITNIIFLLYDYSLTGFNRAYIHWLKPKIASNGHK